MTDKLAIFLSTAELEYMRKAKCEALIQAPTKKTDYGGTEIILTASERIEEAEIIYLWLIKNVVT